VWVGAVLVSFGAAAGCADCRVALVEFGCLGQPNLTSGWGLFAAGRMGRDVAVAGGRALLSVDTTSRQQTLATHRL